MTTTTKRPRSRRPSGRRTTTFPLPPASSVVTLEGRKYVVTPQDKLREWLEGLEDAILGQQALDEPGESIPSEQVKKEPGFRTAVRKAK